MNKAQCVLAVVMSGLLFTTSCGQGEESVKPAEESTEESAPTPGYSNVHQYGGWYCPDNFGFPPVDIQDIHNIPVVTDRLPTLKETRNGTSLMYFDQTKIPDARPLKMDLPRLAQVHNQHSGSDDLVIVIQAVIAGNDTVVGYRFPSGGNGSAWYGQVKFLNEGEAVALGSQPFVFVETEINASREEIWRAFTATNYAEKLGETFNQQAFFSSEWSDDARAHLETDNENFRASGFTGIHFGNLYLHIDYDYNGIQYSEKLLLLESEDDESVKLQLAFGPFPEDYDAQKVEWENWVLDLKSRSE